MGYDAVDKVIYALTGAVLSFVLLVLMEDSFQKSLAESGHYTITQQREDRNECEATIPRNKRCVLSTLWLPEAEGMPNEHLHQ